MLSRHPAGGGIVFALAATVFAAGGALTLTFTGSGSVGTNALGSARPIARVAADATGDAHALGAIRPFTRVAPRVVQLEVLPVAVDLRRWAVAPGDQGNVNSCVAWAIDYAMLGWYSIYSGRVGQPFAPMYTYSQINRGFDGGAVPTDALQIATMQGSDTRVDYTQGDYDWRSVPTAAQRANAAKFKTSGYTTLFAIPGQPGSVALLKEALATMHPVAIELAVRSGFDQLGWSAAAVDNDYQSPIRGYHEVLAVGYDAAGLIIQNSWGSDWANGGFGRISWAVVQHDVWEADTIDGFAVPKPVPLTPPVTTTPAVRATTGGGLFSPVASYTISWTGAVGTSGAITRYDAWYEIDGRGPVALKLPSARSTSVAFGASVGHRYRVGVRARTSTTVGAIRYSRLFLGVR